jgi:hypothetical protein
MNIIQKIIQYFKPEYHFFMLKNGNDLELRIYKNGKPIPKSELLKSKKGKLILEEYLNEQKAKESAKPKKNTKEK